MEATTSAYMPLPIKTTLYRTITFPLETCPTHTAYRPHAMHVNHLYTTQTHSHPHSFPCDYLALMCIKPYCFRLSPQKLNSLYSYTLLDWHHTYVKLDKHVIAFYTNWCSIIGRCVTEYQTHVTSDWHRTF